MLATQYARWHNIQPQGENETDAAFQNRVSGELRRSGNIIEAHEVAQDKRFDEDGGKNVISGITGAMAMALQDKNYGSSGSDLVGDEIAAGILSTNKRSEPDAAMALLAMMLFGK